MLEHDEHHDSQLRHEYLIRFDSFVIHNLHILSRNNIAMIQNDYIYLYSVELEEVEGLETIILAFAWKYDYSTGKVDKTKDMAIIFPVSMERFRVLRKRCEEHEIQSCNMEELEYRPIYFKKYGFRKCYMLKKWNENVEMEYNLQKEIFISNTVPIDLGLSVNWSNSIGGGTLDKYGECYSFNEILPHIPFGWRLPTDKEFKELLTLEHSIQYLNSNRFWKISGKQNSALYFPFVDYYINGVRQDATKGLTVYYGINTTIGVKSELMLCANNQGIVNLIPETNKAGIRLVTDMSLDDFYSSIKSNNYGVDNEENYFEDDLSGGYNGIINDDLPF